MQRTRTSLGVVLAVVATLLLVGCTTSSPGPEPTPSPTPTTSATGSPTGPVTPPPGRVAVVVSPEPELTAAAAEIGTRRVAEGLVDGTELRVVRADDAGFLVDLAAFFATEGYELVCLLGPGAEEAVREVAPDAPSTRFCAAPARADDMPPNVLPITLRVEELGYLAGVALAADGALDGPAGLVTSRVTWQPQRVRAGLVAGLESGGVEGAGARLVGPVDEDTVAEEVTGLLEAGVGGIVSLTGELDAAVRDVVVEVPVTPPAPPSPPPTDAPTAPPPTPSPTPTEQLAALVAGPEARPLEDDGADPVEQLLVVLELHLEQAVALAVERHLGTWDTTAAGIGVAEGAIRVDVTAGPRARAVAEAVDQAVEALRSGDLQVPAG